MENKWNAEYRKDAENVIYVSEGLEVEGSEGFLTDIFASVGEASLTGLKIAGGAAVDGMVTLFNKANRSLILNFGEHKTQFERAIKLVGEKDNEDGITFTKTALSKLTSTGKMSDLPSDIDELIKVMKIVDKYRLDIEAYYEKELSLFSDYKSVNTTESAVKLLKAFDELSFPTIKFGNEKDSMSKTDPLPGGKVFVYKTDSHKFSFELESVTGEESDEKYAPEKIKAYLKQLYALDDIYRVIAKANENYISYLKKFNTVVKDAFGHIEKLEGKVSVSLLTDLQSRLEGNVKTFHFYSSFIPKVMMYIDDVMSTASEFINKQFN